MSAVLILVAFALAVTTFAPRLMTRATWATRNPALGIWAWQTLSTSAAAALVLAGVAAALPETLLGDKVAAALRACSAALANHYETPGGRPVAAVMLMASLALVARFATVLAHDTRLARRHRRTQRDGLALVGIDHPGGFTVVEHGLPLVYCVPGRQQAVVVTSAAQRDLSRHQLDLVLAHERRHLMVRHHLALRVSGALSRTFLEVGVFGRAHREIALLAEMQADDAVQRVTDRRDLARALLTLSPRTPASALAVGAHDGEVGGSALRRVRRLAGERHLVTGHQRIGLILAGVVLLLAPVGLALLPAFDAALRDCCPETVFELGGPGHRAVAER